MSRNSKTVFLDRDGVINEKLDGDYVKTWEEFRFLPGALEAIKLLNGAGYRVAVISNQRGVARGILTAERLYALHEKMRESLAGYGAAIDGFYVCPHEEGTCDCRKPRIGLFLQAEADSPVDRARSFMIGDSERDIEAGRRYGVKTILIDGSGETDFGQDATYPSLLDAAKEIIKKRTTY
jgi:histidinol-phosphate phosphatase family protein